MTHALSAAAKAVRSRSIVLEGFSAFLHHLQMRELESLRGSAADILLVATPANRRSALSDGFWEKVVHLSDPPSHRSQNRKLQLHRRPLEAGCRRTQYFLKKSKFRPKLDQFILVSVVLFIILKNGDRFFYFVFN